MYLSCYLGQHKDKEVGSAIMCRCCGRTEKDFIYTVTKEGIKLLNGGESRILKE